MKRLVSTRNLDRREWLRYRKRGIGGSDAGAVCGLNPYVSAMQVFTDKTTEEISEYDNEAMRQGRDMEDYVARRFMEASGKKVRRANVMFQDERYPFMLADVDRLVVGENAGLECKTVNLYSADSWKDGQVPAHYRIQCYHYMAVLNLDCFYIAALILGKQFIYRKIERDEAVIQNLREIEKNFWESYVLAGAAPPPDGSEAAGEWIKEQFPFAKNGTCIPLYGFDEKLRRREEVTLLLNELENEKSRIEQEVKVYLGEAEAAENEHYRVSWKNTESSKLDAQKLKEDHPDIYKKYCRSSVYRRFLVKAA